MFKIVTRFILKNGVYFWVKGHERCLHKLGLNHLNRKEGMTKAQIVEDYLNHFKIDEDVLSKEMAYKYLLESEREYIKGFE